MFKGYTYANNAFTLSVIVVSVSLTVYLSDSFCIHSAAIWASPPIVVSGLFFPAFVAAIKFVNESAP